MGINTSPPLGILYPPPDCWNRHRAKGTSFVRLASFPTYASLNLRSVASGLEHSANFNKGLWLWLGKTNLWAQNLANSFR